MRKTGSAKYLNPDSVFVQRGETVWKQQRLTVI